MSRLNEGAWPPADTRRSPPQTAAQTAASIRLLAFVPPLAVAAEPVTSVSHHLSATAEATKLFATAIKAAGSQGIITSELIVNIHFRLLVKRTTLENTHERGHVSPVCRRGAVRMFRYSVFRIVLMYKA